MNEWHRHVVRRRPPCLVPILAWVLALAIVTVGAGVRSAYAETYTFAGEFFYVTADSWFGLTGRETPIELTVTFFGGCQKDFLGRPSPYVFVYFNPVNSPCPGGGGSLTARIGDRVYTHEDDYHHTLPPERVDYHGAFVILTVDRKLYDVGFISRPIPAVISAIVR
jgi:hypothetical protein